MMIVTDEMIETGARALAEWAAPQSWGKSKELDNTRRRQVRVVLEAIFNTTDLTDLPAEREK